MLSNHLLKRALAHVKKRLKPDRDRHLMTIIDSATLAVLRQAFTEHEKRQLSELSIGAVLVDSLHRSAMLSSPSNQVGSFKCASDALGPTPCAA